MLNTPPLPVDARQWRRWARPPGAGLALALCEAARAGDAPLVAVMQIGHVRMAVLESLMGVRMRVRFAAVPCKVVCVLMVHIVAVAVLVQQFFVQLLLERLGPPLS